MSIVLLITPKDYGVARQIDASRANLCLPCDLPALKASFLGLANGGSSVANLSFVAQAKKEA
jgi:hypothetical protein